MPTLRNIEVSVEDDEGNRVTRKCDVEVGVFCGKCGADLENQSSIHTKRNSWWDALDVEPCEDCLAAAKAEAEKEGTDANEALTKEIELVAAERDRAQDRVTELESQFDDLRKWVKTAVDATKETNETTTEILDGPSAV